MEPDDGYRKAEPLEEGGLLRPCGQRQAAELGLRALKTRMQLGNRASFISRCFLLHRQWRLLLVLPDVRIPEREERRLSRQCNSQKGKFITDSSQGFLLQPTVQGQKSLKQRLLAKFIRYA